MKRATLLLLVLMVIGGGAVLVESPVAAQSGGWSSPFEVSPPVQEVAADTPGQGKIRKYPSSWFPDLTTGPDGSVHIVWYSGIVTGDDAASTIDLLMYREHVQGVWSKANEIAAPARGGFTVRNSIVASRDGRLHVLLRSTTSTGYSSAPLAQALSARSWSEVQPLSSNAAYYNALAVDSKGGLHAVWSEAQPEDGEAAKSPCALCADIIYRSSSDGGEHWSAPINLSQTLDGENRPQLKIDKFERIHAVWDAGFDWYVTRGVPRAGVYRRSDDGGKTWSKPALFRLPASVARRLIPPPSPLTPTPDPDASPSIYYDAVQQTALAVDLEGNPLVVYRGVLNDKLYFQRSLDGGTTWSGPAEMPGVIARNINDNNLDCYTMASDSLGHIHLLMVGYRSDGDQGRGTPSLLHLTWDGNRWSAPSVVMRNDLYPEWPRVAIGKGNQLHVTWFTRSKENLFRSERGGYRVWYSTRLVNAPATTPLPTFTATATVAPTTTPAIPPTPTPVPLPPSSIAAPPITGPPAWEGPALQTIIIALLPVVGFVLLIFGVRWLRSRRQ